LASVSSYLFINSLWRVIECFLADFAAKVLDLTLDGAGSLYFFSSTFIPHVRHTVVTNLL